MLISRSPLRLSLGGGGTDLPSYYKDHGGFFISAAIDKYVYLTLHRTFQQEIILKYSELERVKAVDEIRHPIIRECLKVTNTQDLNLEITSLANVPSGTGLGSSGSFTTALLKLLNSHQGIVQSPRALAEQACHVELERLHEPIGKQDQYIAAYGGVTCFEIAPTGEVESYPAQMSRETYYDLEDNLVLFFTGFSRPAGKILKEQDDKSKAGDTSMIEGLHFIKDIGQRTAKAFREGRLGDFAELMNVHWEWKKKRSGAMSNPAIDEGYALGLKNGALGGKLIGAGGGGFLMFFAEDKSRLRRALGEKLGLQEMRFRFEPEGTKLIATTY